LDKQEFLRLLDRYLDGKASDQEIELLENYYNSFQQTNEWNEAELGNSQELGSHMLEQIKDVIQKAAQAPVFPLHKRRWLQVAAAAVVLFVLGVSIWEPVQKKAGQPIAAVDVSKSLTRVIKSNHTVLIMANGEHIDLDSVNNGVVAYQDQIKIIKQDSQLVFQQSGAQAIDPSGTISFHTVAVPKGGHYKVVLPDGSMVWLNAASMLRFSTSFKANERKVDLSGEAYFEVAKDRARPFRVHVSAQGINSQNGALIEVLGTHFNINAYSDEALLKTTLVEGSVKITPVHSSGLQTRNSRILAPGQQAQITDRVLTPVEMGVETVDVETVLAWKNNMFNFNNADIQAIMRQIARWYDVEVVYEGKIPEKNFSGKINRNSELKTVLKIIEQSGIRFHLEGKKVIVRS
jgi:transmembrane sensor